MGNLFGKHSQKPTPKKSRVTEQDKAVLQLKHQRDKLKQYQKRIMLALAKERELAKKLIRENKKDRAKLLLKKKRYQEQVIEQTDKQLNNLETMVHDIEFAQIEIQVVNGLKVGNEALKKVHDILSIEEIENIMHETQEGIDKQKEIDEILTGALTEEDEDAVLLELDKMITDSLPAVAQEEELELPEVPSGEPAHRVKVKRPLAGTDRVAIPAL